MGAGWVCCLFSLPRRGAARLDARRLSTAHPRRRAVCPRRRLLGAPGCRRSRADRLRLAGRRANSRIALRADIKKVRVYSSNADRRSRFATEWQASLDIEVRPVGAARDAFAKADIVALATNANEKVMESIWIEPGQHLSSVRFLELDPRSYEDSDRVVVNRAEPWIQNYYLGELCPQDIRDAKLPLAPPGAIEAREFFRRRIKRTGAQEKTLFPNEASNYQLGGQFAAVAGFVLDRAREKGLGRDLPADWFAQTLLP